MYRLDVDFIIFNDQLSGDDVHLRRFKQFGFQVFDGFFRPEHCATGEIKTPAEQSVGVNTVGINRFQMIQSISEVHIPLEDNEDIRADLSDEICKILKPLVVGMHVELQD